MVQKIYSRMQPVSCTNTHHDVRDLVNCGMVKNTKTWIPWEWSITFLRNKNIFNLCIGLHILRSYSFTAVLTFKTIEHVKKQTVSKKRMANFKGKQPESCKG